MRRLLLIIISLIVSHYTLTAQYKTWSLRECMLYAIENSPKTKIQEALNEDRKIDNREAYLNWLPSVSGQTGANSYFGRSIDPETNTYTTTASFSNNYSISASYYVFNGFSTVNNYKISRIAMLSGVQEQQQLENDICLRVIQAYYNLLYRIGMVEITKEQLDESSKALHQTKIMEELGLKGHSDVLQMEARVATNDYNYVKEQNNLSDALLTLKSIMYLPNTERFEVDKNIVPIVDPFLAPVASDPLFQSAIMELPNIKIADYQLRQAELNYNTSKWRVLPSIYLSGGISTGFMTPLGSASSAAKPFMEQITANAGQAIGVGVSIPIFNSLGRWNTRAKMKNALLRAQCQKEEKIREVENEIQRSIQEMEGAAKEFAQADKREAAQKMAYQANAKKYDEGLISVLDLELSANQLLISKVERLNSAFTYLLKKRVVNYYKGIPYLEQE